MSIPLWITIQLGEIVLDTQPGFAQRPNQGNIGVPQLRTNNISREGDLDLSDISYVNADDSMIQKYGVLRGDIVFNNTNSPELVGKTAYFDIDTTWVISNHMTRIRVDPDLVDAEYLSRYLHYLWQTGRSKQWAKQWVNQAAIDQPSLRKFDVPLPPLPEQRRIAAILRQADMLRKWRQDANEKIKALCKSLFYNYIGDPDPDRNNYGWERVKIGDILDVGTGGTPSRSNKEYYGGPHHWVKTTELKDETILSTEETITDKGLKNSNAKIYPVNTVLVAMYGQGQTRGRTGKLGLPAAVNQACAAFSPSDELLPDYLWHWFQNSYDRIRSMSRGGPQENLNLQILKGLYILKPPKDVQLKLIALIEHHHNIWETASTTTEKFYQLFHSVTARAFTGELTAFWREKYKEELQRAAVERDQKLGLRGEVATLKDAEEGRLTPEEEEQLRQALGQFAVNVNRLAEPMRQSMLESVRQMSMVYQDIVDPLLQNIRSSMQAASSVLLEKIQPISRENFLAYINNLPVPQEKRAIIETLDTTTIQVLKLAGTYPAYFTADDLEAGELGGITTLQAEGSLRTLQALGFVKLVQIDGLLRYRLTDENDYTNLPSSLSVQS